MFREDIWKTVHSFAIVNPFNKYASMKYLFTFFKQNKTCVFLFNGSVYIRYFSKQKRLFVLTIDLLISDLLIMAIDRFLFRVFKEFPLSAVFRDQSRSTWARHTVYSLSSHGSGGKSLAPSQIVSVESRTSGNVFSKCQFGSRRVQKMSWLVFCTRATRGMK